VAFLGIGVMLSPFGDLRHQNRAWRAAGVPILASARTRRFTGRQQGLKILAREAYKIAVPKAPISQANWLWDCTTPDTALAGTSVSAGAICFGRETSDSVLSFPQLSCVTARIPSPIASWFAPVISHAGR
jgi:hypothetical protein